MHPIEKTNNQSFVHDLRIHNTVKKNNSKYKNNIIFSDEKLYKICLLPKFTKTTSILPIVKPKQFFLTYRSLVNTEHAGTVMDQLIAFGLCRVWKAFIIFL